MRVYNLVGYALLLLHLAISWALAPAGTSPWLAVAIGTIYLLGSWFLAGLYLSDIIHMGIAHRALDYRPGFVKAVTLLNNSVGIYVDPVTWVNRHRHHHAFSDHAGDPNKLESDGFWKTMYLCLFPYSCERNLANDPILRSLPFRLVSNPVWAIAAQGISIGALWLVVRDWPFTLAVWASVRVFALWVNMIQNYWTHDRRFGTRRYDDAGDNAMNIGDWLPVMATFSACWQNNHHHHDRFLRLSHSDSEFDFGFLTVRVMSRLGLVRPSATGAEIPAGVELDAAGI